MDYKMKEIELDRIVKKMIVELEYIREEGIEFEYEEDTTSEDLTKKIDKAIIELEKILF
jgi:hypothetical protein